MGGTYPRLYYMINFASIATSSISVDCIKHCPFRPNLFAFAYYQTNPDTKGAIAVAQVEGPTDLEQIEMVECPPLLHLVWARLIGWEDRCLLFAASRTDDVLIYECDLGSAKLTLKKTLAAGQNIFCLYLDVSVLEDCYRLLVSTNDSQVIDLLLRPDFSTLCLTQQQSIAKSTPSTSSQCGVAG